MFGVNFSDFLKKQWIKYKEKPQYKESLERFEDYIISISEEEELESPGAFRFRAFCAGLSEYNRCITGLKISIYEEGQEILFFDTVQRKIFKIKDDKSEEIMPFSEIKHCRLSYRPCLMQNEKVRFKIDCNLIGHNNKVLLKLHTVESCYDEDRRSYEDQLEPYVETGRAIAGAGGWVFKKSCSTTF
jgi:hypothetical protein